MMLNTTNVRAALPSLALVLMVSASPANAAGECQDIMQPPDAQRAACDAAIQAATDPVERARLLVQRAGAWRRGQSPTSMDQGLDDLEEAERLAPDADPQLRADMLVQRSDVYRVQGDFDAALADIEEAERLAPNDADPLINRGNLLRDQGDIEGGLVQLARARALEPDQPRPHLASMLPLYEAGELEACVESGNKLVELAPADVRVWSARGLCLAELGRTDEALADLKEAERLGPYLMVTHEDIAYAYLALGRPEDVLATARRAVEMDPMDEVAQGLLTRGLVETGALDEAIAAYQEAEAAGVEDKTGARSNNIAWGLFMAGEHEKALPIIEQGLAGQTEPAADFIDTHAHLLAAVGRSDEAVEAFLRAVEIGGPEFRSMYEAGLTALGHTVEPGDEGLEAALRAGAATGEACRLFSE